MRMAFSIGVILLFSSACGASSTNALHENAGTGVAMVSSGQAPEAMRGRPRQQGLGETQWLRLETEFREGSPCSAVYLSDGVERNEVVQSCHGWATSSCGAGLVFVSNGIRVSKASY